jgi:hypothetical protein
MELSSDTTSLLRPNQVEEMHEEIHNLEKMLSAPPHIRSQITDRRSMQQRLIRLKKEADDYTPRPFQASERDAAVKEFAALADTIRAGMPSSEEMRRNPPGAVGKQTTWDKRNKKAVQRYKHLALRLLAGGDLPAHLDHAGDVANIEMLRPLKTSHDVSMDGAQIPKKTDIHIGADPVGTVLFTAEEEAALNQFAPALAGMLAVMDNDQRTEVKAMLEKLMAAQAVPSAPKPEKPALQSLHTNTMKSMCAKAGMENARTANRGEMTVFLRNRNLIS